MLRGDGVTRDLLAELIRRTVDETVRKQLQRRAQEPPISSKVAEALEKKLHGYEINGYAISVVAQDFPDRGPGSWEHKSGADLYIGIRVETTWDLPPVSKGMLIQAKKAKMPGTVRRPRTPQPASAADAHGELVEQCGKMLDRTNKGAFVWVYGIGGTHAVPASDVVASEIVPPEHLGGRDVGEQFRDVLDCISGDEDLVDETIFDDDEALGNYLEEIAVRRGVAINVAPAKPDRRG
jgi:hypothetical protein